ncbi:MAG: histidinol-phosphate transaminase [Dehalococcoidia bacterium]|nr:histidinol-phosphate transaminase [Dehalococcoidia bacterium]
MARQDMHRLIRADMARAGAYASIRPLDVLSENCGVPAAMIIKLDGNENPYGCSPRVRRALADYSYYNIYPDPKQQNIRKALEKYVGVSADRIIAGAGSDELIDLVLRLMVDPGDEVINCPPTFGMYSFSTDVCSGKVITVPRFSDFSVDIEGVKRAVTPRTKVIFVASPNNPTGNVTTEKDIRALLELGVLVVADEAYYEFSGCTSVKLMDRYDNLVVLRTFSKWAGLAGLRVGCGVFPDALMPHLMKIKQPYNVNVAAEIALQESLVDVDYLMEIVKTLVHERGHLYRKLQQFDFLQPYPSQANFILFKVSNGKAKRIHEALCKRGIFLRHFDTPLLKDCLRVSVGKPEHTEALAFAIEQIVNEDEDAKLTPPKFGSP